MAFALISPILIEVGFSVGDIGKVVNIYGFFGGVIASFGAGFLCEKMGAKRALFWLLGAEIIGVHLVTLPLFGVTSFGAVTLICAVMFGFYVAQQVVIMTMMMKKIRSDVASEYALQGSFGMIFQFVSFYGGMFVAQFWGYFCAINAACALCVLALVYAVKFRQFY